ncbi:hypothetical protein [uncultured Endozoicomonas sp.]|uniref:hypothetical protein n=1 Tax=uncultured Endozoicomonas sp. TaxID=432652 RepID=UPI0026364D6B|nr:hypothetical protein [uncultured Endozoicomonas sp.]
MSKPRPKQKSKGASGTEKRMLIKCPYQDCTDGMVKGMFGSRSECATCNGSGLVDAETGEPLPDQEIIRQLLIRYQEQKWQIYELKKCLTEQSARLAQYEQDERGR